MQIVRNVWEQNIPSGGLLKWCTALFRGYNVFLDNNREAHSDGGTALLSDQNMQGEAFKEKKLKQNAFKKYVHYGTFA